LPLTSVSLKSGAIFTFLGSPLKVVDLLIFVNVIHTGNFSLFYVYD